MKLKWHLFRVICVMQILCGLYFSMTRVVQLLNTGHFPSLLFGLAWVLVIGLAAFGISLLSRNYPSVPVEGQQKKSFNRLYLVNIIALVFIFAELFGSYTSLRNLASLTQRPWYGFGFEWTHSFLLSCLGLLLQFLILYGLYVLRRELYDNFHGRKFEFEG